MKNTKCLLSAAFIALLAMCCHSSLLAQTVGNIPSAAQVNSQRVEDLFQKVTQEILPLPISELPCLLQQLRGEQREFPAGKADLERGLTEVERMRKQGNETCAFDLLDELQTAAEKNPADHLKWQYEKTRTLTDFEYSDSAMVEALHLTTLAENYGQFQGWATLAKALVFHKKRDFEHTYQLAEEALEIARSEKDKMLEAKSLSTIGRVTRDIYMVVPEKNVPFHLQALAIAKELRDTAFMISELSAISISYDGTSETHKSFDYIEQANNLLRPGASLGSRLNCVRMLAIYMHTHRELDKALPLYEHAIFLSKKLRYHGLTQNIYEQVSGIWMTKKDYDKALAAMDSAKSYSDFKAELGFFYRSYADIHEAKGDMTLALEYHKKAFEEQVKGYTNRNSALLTENETRFRTREKELQIEQQKRQRWMMSGLATALALLFAGAVFAVIKQRQGRQKLASQNALIEAQAEELRHLDKIKSNFFANVSHELRTPLTLMLGPIGSALKRNRLENYDFTLLKLAQQHGHQLLKLISQILDLSKLESGKLELYEAPARLHPLLNRLVAAFESHAGRLGIQFSFQYKADKNLQLELDAAKLETILNNLLSNAMKFTPPGGKVSVVVEDLASNIRLTVSDTGRGIHPADLLHVFDRFYQSNQPGAKTEGGTGIGLALCRELAELMQGKIWVESELEKGSRFVFEFPKKEILGVFEPSEEPLAEEAAIALPAAAEALSAEAKNGRANLLVVEDNASLRDYLKLILSEKYNVQTAEHGQAALDWLTANRQQPTADLILSDVMMPVMDGFQLLEKLKGDDRFRHLPVVMLTARADVQDKLRALRIGVDDYLLKPFEEEELLVRLENLLKNQAERKRSEIGNQQVVNADGIVIQEKTLEMLPETAVTKLVTEEEQAWLEELENLVKSKLSDSQLTADTLAEALAMSRAQFFRQTKKLAGLTPAQYVDEARFRHARFLLETGKVRSVKSAAFEVGFRQVEHFSRQFKDRFGKYPSAYLSE